MTTPTTSSAARARVLLEAARPRLQLVPRAPEFRVGRDRGRGLLLALLVVTLVGGTLAHLASPGPRPVAPVAPVTAPAR